MKNILNRLFKLLRLFRSKNSQTQKINYECRAVGFIDVLGFGNIVNSSVCNGAPSPKLENLVRILESAVPSFDAMVDPDVPIELIPKHIYISDCIILSAPVKTPNNPDYNGLEILCMRIIQIGLALLEHGYLIRGGVSVGPVWHNESNIVGPAYQKAVKIEKETRAPRVVLSDEAAEFWHQYSGTHNKMCINYRNKTMVNILHDYYMKPEHKTREDAIKKINSIYSIASRKLCETIDESARYKWWWFMEYLDKTKNTNPFLTVNWQKKISL